MAKVIPCYREKKVVHSWFKGFKSLINYAIKTQLSEVFLSLWLEKGGKNVNNILYIEKIDVALFGTICNFSFANFSLCHHRTQLGENNASVQQSILFSMQN